MQCIPPSLLLVIVICLNAGISPISGQKQYLPGSAPLDTTPLTSDFLFYCRPSIAPTGKGDIYQQPKWEKALIVYNNQKMYHLPTRYRVSSDEMEIKWGSKTYTLHTHALVRIQFPSQTFAPFPIKGENGNQVGYFEVLSEGQCPLLRRYQSQIASTQMVKGEEINYYKTTASYYSSKPNNPAYTIKTGKRNILKVLSDQKKTLLQFVKDQALSYQKEADLVVIFDYYNTL